MDITNIAQKSLTSVLVNNNGSDYVNSGTAGKSTIGSAVSNGVLAGALNTVSQSNRNRVSLLEDFRFGSLLARSGKVSGSTATIIDSLSGLILGAAGVRKYADIGIDTEQLATTRRFIPIVLRTNHKIITSADEGVKQFYVVFDSTPDSITFNKSANWSAQNFPGRPEPVQIFENSSPITFDLKGMFFSRSKEDLLQKLALGESLMALVSPTQEFFMPSTVTVLIGEWQELNCIVNSVNITYQGPWWIPTNDGLTSRRATSTTVKTDVPNTNFATPFADGGFPDVGSVVNVDAIPSANGTTIETESPTPITLLDQYLPAHAPYVFEADFSFTVVSKGSQVKYAENILNERISKDNLVDRIEGSTYALQATNDDGTPGLHIYQVPGDVSSLSTHEWYIATTINPALEGWGDGMDLLSTMQERRDIASEDLDRTRQAGLLGALSQGINAKTQTALSRVLLKNKGILGRLVRGK